jgi:transposase
LEYIVTLLEIEIQIPIGRTNNMRRAIALEREETLCLYKELHAQSTCSLSLSKTLKISSATYYRWKRAYGSKGLTGLLPKSIKPHRVRTREVLTQSMITKIKKLRNQNPMYSRAKIHALLLRSGITISQSSVNRTLKDLMSRNLVVPVVVLKCAKERKLIRDFKQSHSKRLSKNYLDHTLLNLRGIEIKQFVAVEKHTRYCVSKAYANVHSANTADFLNKVITQLPMPLEDIQVDGGTEFRAEFEKACKDKILPLFVLPEINGKIERLNQT